MAHGIVYVIVVFDVASRLCAVRLDRRAIYRLSTQVGDTLDPQAGVRTVPAARLAAQLNADRRVAHYGGCGWRAPSTSPVSCCSARAGSADSFGTSCARIVVRRSGCRENLALELRPSSNEAYADLNLR